MLKLCALSDLPIGPARRALVGTTNLLLIRTAADSVHAYLNRCPHLGIPLTWQDGQLMSPDGEYIQCAMHGALFEPTTGYCISGPCRGDELWSITCTINDQNVLIDEAELPTTPPINP